MVLRTANDLPPNAKLREMQSNTHGLVQFIKAATCDWVVASNVVSSFCVWQGGWWQFCAAADDAAAAGRFVLYAGYYVTGPLVQRLACHRHQRCQ